MQQAHLSPSRSLEKEADPIVSTSAETASSSSDKPKENSEDNAMIQRFAAEDFPGAYESKLGSFLTATSTKLSQLPESSDRGEWAAIIAKRCGRLEVWALEDLEDLAGTFSHQSGVALLLGLGLGALLSFMYLAYF